MRALTLSSVWFSLAVLLSACDSGGGSSSPAPTSFVVEQTADATMAVGAAGGEVATEDRRVVLDIPAGALTANTTLTITEIDPATLGPEFDGLGATRAFELGPTGLAFAEPIQVSMTLAEPVTVEPDGTVVIRQQVLLTSDGLATEGLTAQEVAVDVDAGTTVVSGQLNHFSPLVVVQGSLTARVSIPDAPVSGRAENVLISVTSELEPDPASTLSFVAPVLGFGAEVRAVPLTFNGNFSLLESPHSCLRTAADLDFSYLASISGRVHFPRRSDDEPPREESLNVTLRKMVTCKGEPANVEFLLTNAERVPSDPALNLRVGELGSLRIQARSVADGMPIELGAVEFATLEQQVVELRDPSSTDVALSQTPVVGQTPGTAAVVANLQFAPAGSDSATSAATISVTEPRVIAIRATPAEVSLPVGATVQVHVDAMFDFGPDRRLDPSEVAFTITNPTAISGTDRGEVTGRTAGATSQFVATFEEKFTSVFVSVTEAEVIGLRIQPVTGILAVTQQIPFQVFGQLTDGTEVDFTEQADWQVPAPGPDESEVARVSNAAGSKGQVTGIGVGATQVSATFGAFSVDAEVVVEALRTARFEIRPAGEEAVVVVNGELQLRLFEVFEQNVPDVDLTLQADWRALGLGAEVTSGDFSRGLVTGLRLGVTTIVAGVPGMEVRTEVTVVAGRGVRPLSDATANTVFTIAGNFGGEQPFNGAPGAGFTQQLLTDPAQLGVMQVDGFGETFVFDLLSPDLDAGVFSSRSGGPLDFNSGAQSVTVTQPGNALPNVVGAQPDRFFPLDGGVLEVTIPDLPVLSLHIGPEPADPNGQQTMLFDIDGLASKVFVPMSNAMGRVVVTLRFPDGASGEIRGLQIVRDPVSGEAGSRRIKDEDGIGIDQPGFIHRLVPEGLDQLILDAGGLHPTANVVIGLQNVQNVAGVFDRLEDDPDDGVEVPVGGGHVVVISPEFLDRVPERCPDRPTGVRCEAGTKEFLTAANRNGETGLFDAVSGEFNRFFLRSPNFVVDNGFEITQGPDNCLVFSDSDNGVWLYDVDGSLIRADGMGNILVDGAVQPLIAEPNVRGIAFHSPGEGLHHLYLAVRADLDGNGFPSDGSRIVRFNYDVNSSAVLSNRTVLVELANAQFNDVVVIDDRVYVSDEFPDSSVEAQDLVRVFDLDGVEQTSLLTDSVTPNQIVELFDGTIGVAEFGRRATRIVQPDGTLVRSYSTANDDGDDGARGYGPLRNGNYLVAGQLAIGVSVQDRFDGSLRREDTGSTERFIGSACLAPF